jgi:hypothetical protein
MTVTGRPWDELENSLTWQRIEALYEYWRKHPPAHVLVAGYLGYKPPEKPKSIEELRHTKGEGQLSIAELEALGFKLGFPPAN